MGAAASSRYSRCIQNISHMATREASSDTSSCLEGGFFLCSPGRDLRPSRTEWGGEVNPIIYNHRLARHNKWRCDDRRRVRAAESVPCSAQHRVGCVLGALVLVPPVLIHKARRGSSMKPGIQAQNCTDRRFPLHASGLFCRYCPQFDMLLPYLTVEETLWLYASLRGIPRKHRIDDIANLMALVRTPTSPNWCS